MKKMDLIKIVSIASKLIGAFKVLDEHDVGYHQREGISMGDVYSTGKEFGYLICIKDDFSKCWKCNRPITSIKVIYDQTDDIDCGEIGDYGEALCTGGDVLYVITPSCDDCSHVDEVKDQKEINEVIEEFLYGKKV